MTTPYDSAPAAVRLKGVYKSYRSGSVTTPVLRGIDLEIRTDQLSVLAGPSGCGKTTLLNLIGCIDLPDQGEIEVLGQRVQTLNDNALSDFRRDQISFVFQNFNLLPVLTAYENVEYPLVLAGIRNGRRERVLEALDQVGLAAHANKYPAQLSGGQRQRVAIARALVKSPRLVLADEPTANLDSENSDAIMALIRTLQQRHHIAFVISSHDAAVKAHADRVLPLLDGQLLAAPSVAAASGAPATRVAPSPVLELPA